MRKNNPTRRAVKKDAKVTGIRTEENKHPIIVVGVGASVGSQKSLQKLFSEMPTGRGVAFVLVQHLEPTLKNKIVRSLKDRTALAVVEAMDGMPVLADRIHVIPPDKYLNISRSILTLQEPILCDGLRMPIDHFFCSLAVDQRRRSIGILLSGRGSDGTLGLSEIKAAGGRTLIEDPGSAIDTGVVDSVLPATGMAAAVMTLVEQVIAETSSSLAGSQDIDADLRAVLDILRAKLGHDFRCYKPSTLVRRIRRRMSLATITSLEGYAQFLREHPEEVGLLQKDLFIGVTDFFRQPHAWETLAEKVIVPLVDNAQPGSEIRVWVPGCSTGKEAYSLAMLLTELVEKSGKKVNVQIFATDSDLASLATARSGIYSKEDMGENISAERLKRFFARKDGHYQVVKDIREMVVFASQNITADPPFSRLDLISCRNLLIYLDQQVQRKIIDLFHFSLREGGTLFLGTAETVGNREELFEPVSKKWRIYRRIGVGHRVGVEIPVRLTGEPGRAAAKLPPAAPPSRMSLASGAQHMLLDRFAPACVMIDRKLQVIYVHGAVEDYLTFPPGELTTRVIDMAREGLRARLRGAISKYLESNKSVSVTARVRRGDKSIPVKTVVSPLRYPREIDGLLLITFEDYLIPVAKTSGKLTKESDTQHLMDELKITREELQSTIEQLEHSNDELKASNEEVTAANEELQSANEELETSKEELQSLNEELNTINIRLQEKVEELEGVNNDVVNLLSSTNIATVFLDKDLRVKRYTPAITRLLSLIPSDTGRHIGDVLRKFSDDMLLDDSRRVLACLTPLSAEVQADDGRWYIRSITPYRTQDDRIEGVVITLVDVADLKRAEEALQQLNSELEERVAEQTGELRTASLYSRSLIEASLDPLVTISPEGRIMDVNEATEQVTGRTRRELIGTDFLDYFTEPDAAQMGYRKVFADGQVRDYPLTIRDASGTTTDVLYNATIYRNEAGDVQGVFAAARDVTELKRAEAALKEVNETLEQRVAERTAELRDSEGRYRELVQNANSAIIRWKSDGSIVFFNEYAQNFFGYRTDEVIGRHVGILVPEQDSTGGDLTGLVQDIVNHPERHVNNINENICRDGRRVWMAWTNRPILDENGNVSEILAVGTDITDRKRAENALLTTLQRMHTFVASMHTSILLVGDDGRIALANQAFCDYFDLQDSPADLVGITAREMIEKVKDAYVHPAEAVTHIMEIVRREETVIGEEIAMQDGRTCLRDFIPIEADGKSYGLLWQHTDITERKQAEEAILRAKQEWERTFDAVPDLIAILDNSHHILRANRAMAERLGVAPQQCVGEACHTAVHGLDYPPDFCPHTLALADGQEHIAEVHEDCLSGDFLVSATPLTDEQGRLIGSVHVARDITKRKQAEQILRERTAELEALNKELESFSYSVSHDLRAPLRAIDGYARSILKKQEDKFDEPTKRKFNDIRSNAKMMGQLIDDLLAFSRLGKKQLSLTKLDLDAVIMDVWKELKTINPERDTKLTLNSMPVGYGDRMLIKQVYFNLLSNAVKFTKFRDQAHIEAGGYTEGNEDVFYIKDNGVGFDMAYYDKLFGVFQRLHNPDDFEGTGVGLATIQRIIHRHDGRVWAEGKVNEGATFYFSLPRKM